MKNAPSSNDRSSHDETATRGRACGTERPFLASFLPVAALLSIGAAGCSSPDEDGGGAASKSDTAASAEAPRERAGPSLSSEGSVPIPPRDPLESSAADPRNSPAESLDSESSPTTGSSEAGTSATQPLATATGSYLGFLDGDRLAVAVGQLMMAFRIPEVGTVMYDGDPQGPFADHPIPVGASVEVFATGGPREIPTATTINVRHRPERTRTVEVGDRVCRVRERLFTRPFGQFYPKSFRSSDTGHVAFASLVDGTTYITHDGAVAARGEDWDSITLSPDGSRLACSTQVGGQWQVVVDGEALPESFEGSAKAVTFSATNRLAFAAQESGGAQYVWFEGRKLTIHDGMAFMITFDPDGEHIAYPVKVDGTWHLLIDGERLIDLPTGFVATTPVILDADGSFAVGVTHESGSPTHVFVDGELGPAFDSLDPSTLQFLADGRLAYSGQRDADGAVVALGDQLHSGCRGLTLSPNRASYAWVHEGDEQHELWVNGQNVMQAESIRSGSLMFDPEGERIACVARHEGAASVYVDGEQLTEGWEEIVSGSLTFSEDASALAYVGVRDNKHHVVWGDEVAGPYDYAASLAFRPGSSADLFWISQFGSDEEVAARSPNAGQAVQFKGVELVAGEGFLGGSIGFDESGQVQMTVSEGQDLIRVEIAVESP